MGTLLAKSGRGAPSLLEHTMHVMGAAEALFGTAGAATRLGRCWLRFFKIDESEWATFHGTLLAACALHDWGKANDRMQDVLARKTGATQAIRHEHFSTLLVAQPVCWDWLGLRPELDREVILSAVLTHHLKAAFSANHLRGFANAENRAKGFRSLHGSDDFATVLRNVETRLELPRLDLSAVGERWAFEGSGVVIGDHKKRIQNAIFQPFKVTIDPQQTNNARRRRRLNAVRSALIAADAAGSGLTRTGHTISEWIANTFSDAQAWDAADVREKVIRPRLARIEQVTKKPFEWNEFQDDCGDPTKVPDRALLLAPCGSGKTLAAWRWIEAQLTQKTGHVLFLYPTRATATEGFRDYVSWAPEAEARLMHGTSAFDLKDMFGNADDSDPRKGRVYDRETEMRLYSLGHWGRRAFSATVDQFLAFLQYGYGPVCMLPVLADSVVVIDEVHSFDRNMFAALKKFLTDFRVPVLCMTATLPSNRRDELVDDCGLTPYEERKGKLQTIADAPRYRLRRAADRDEAEDAVRHALKAGRRVLWVVNTVRRAHAVLAKFVTELPAAGATDLASGGVPVYCYHSRFRLKDRVSRHKDVIDTLKKENPGPALGVTTQVCEMSLDIDVDLLVTEECPVTALVQRMGRCNRQQDPRPLGTAGEVIVYKPAEDLPYNREQLTGLQEFLDLVGGRELSQGDLEKAMGDETVDPPPSMGDPIQPFLESGPYAVAGEEQFRDSEEHNRPCVLPTEVAAYLNAESDEQPGFTLPVPKKLARGRDDAENESHAKLPPYLGVAADGRYHPAVGYCDRPLTEWGAE